MTDTRGSDLAGRTLRVADPHRGANPRLPNTHGWLAFEVLRRAPRQELTAEEYERRLFSPSHDIETIARDVPGVRNAYQDLKHIRCDIARGHVTVSPPLPSEWYQLSRCGGRGR